jgi:hypothetical protein
MLAADNKDIIILGNLNLSLNKTKDLQEYISDPHWRSRLPMKMGEAIEGLNEEHKTIIDPM